MGTVKAKYRIAEREYETLCSEEAWKFFLIDLMEEELFDKVTFSIDELEVTHGPEVIHIRLDDWEVLYVNGKVVAQSHSLSGPDTYFWLKAAQEHGFELKDIKTAKESQAVYDMVYESGRFPDELPYDEEWVQTLEYY